MKTSIAILRTQAISLLSCITLLAACTLSASAQKPETRIVAPIDNATRSTLNGTRPPMAQAANDAGRMPGTTPLQSMSIVFSRSAAQQSALDALIAAQQNPASAQYHQWLEPDQFAAEFGASDADIAKVGGWLQSQGFTVGAVSRSRMELSFSGTTAQVEAAFGTEMHYFKTANGETHFGPNSDLSVPAAMAPAVMGVAHLTDQRPHSHMRPVELSKVNSHFTSSQSGNTFLTPGDVAVIYDINPAYTAGYTGLGQTIAIVGQSAVVAADITNFQNASGTPVRTPAMNLIPNTGTSTVDPYGAGDESESDIDLEYSGAIAKGASIAFYYTGGAANNGGAFYALQYMIQNKVAPIISNSYGDCEVDIGQSDYSTMNAYLQQAVALGLTVISAAGDQGAEDCYEDTNSSPALSLAQQGAVSVDWPASSQYVTGMGGTEFPAADVVAAAVVGANSSTYWNPATTTTGDVVTSAKSYIPEMVWNDDAATSGLSAGGGGISIFSPQPTWQAGVPGITAGSFRLVPDISLASSPNNAGYLYCSSDIGNTGITGSCSNGFRDVTATNLTVAGGTSFAAPIFAGMMAIINQKTNTLYAGLVNPELYKLASTPATYASAFHDITSGNNGCASGVAYATNFNTNGTVARYGPACTSAEAGLYATTTGYDEATGLGSVDLFNLLSAWPVSVPLTGSSSTVTAGTLTPTQGSSDTITFKVASASSSVTTTPTGTISLSIDGSYIQLLTLTGGTATYAYSSNTLGAHVITGVYQGDTVFSTSTGTITLTVISSNSATTLAAATTPATAGTADTITVTVTSAAAPAPTGTVSVTIDGVAASGSPFTLTPGSTSATAAVPFTASTLGSHTIAATYNGNGTYQTSGGTLTLMAKSPGTFTIAAPADSVTHGNSTTETVTLTSTGGYFGVTNLSLTPASIVNACYSLSNPTLTAGAAVPVAVTIYTNSTSCSSQNLLRNGTSGRAANEAPAAPRVPLPAGLAVAGLLAVGWLGRRSRKLRGLVTIAVLAVAGFAISGCGSTSTAGAGISTTAPTGSYTVTVTGTDATTGTITASTTFTLTIQ